MLKTNWLNLKLNLSVKRLKKHNLPKILLLKTKDRLMKKKRQSASRNRLLPTLEKMRNSRHRLSRIESKRRRGRKRKRSLNR